MNEAESQALWSRLSAAGLTVGEQPETDTSHAPWYVRLMLCLAGFIAAVFLVGFVSLAFQFVIDNTAASIAVGLVLIGGAYALFRAAPRSDFGSMFALAVSFAGQAFFLIGLVRFFGHDENGVVWTLVAAFEAGLAFVMPNFIHRVVSACGASVAFAYALQWLGGGVLSAGVIGAGVCWIWLNEARLAPRASVAIPIGYGLTLGFIQAQASTLVGLTMGMDSIVRPNLPSWLGDAAVSAALIATVVVLVTRAGWSLRQRPALFAIGAGVAVSIASYKAPGIAGGLMIALLGYANGNRVLTGLGIASLVFYASRYYYFFDVTLLVKAAALAATGAVLLGARWLVLNVIVQERDTHA